jgi:hypothetical protein
MRLRGVYRLTPFPQPIPQRVVLAAGAFGGEENALHGVDKPAAEGGFGGFSDVGRPGSFNFVGGELPVGGADCLRDSSVVTGFELCLRAGVRVGMK